MTHATTAALAIALLLAGTQARAQGGGAYDLRHNTIDGGGATFSSNTAYSLGGTVGQPDAGRLSGGTYSLSGGFWAGIQGQLPSPTPTASLIATATASFTPSPLPSRTSTGTVAPTATRSHTAIPSAIATPTRTATQSTAATATQTTAATEALTPTASPSPSPTESPNVTPAAACVGDCNLDAAVTIAELLRLVNIALGRASVETCAAGDSNPDGRVTINELLQAVISALDGCS